ncbi:MAG TPA: peptidylprolyl isomerase [Candidatus Xenobia bacterium]|nr:peptidylprolyl isomerase [Candidatus Xenobia bacterium]
MKKLVAVLCLVLSLSLAWAQEKAPAKTAKATPRDPGLYATLDTTMGKIVIKLFEKEAPNTVRNFVDLATGKKAWRESKTGKTVTGQPFFDGVIFHRVIPGFMAQSGSHLPDGSWRQSAPIPDEFHPGLKHDRAGRLSMANAGPNTGSSQFFITYVPTPHLDGRHAVFGQVVEGQDVLEAMAKVELKVNERGERAIPVKPIVINKLTIQRVPSGSETK